MKIILCISMLISLNLFADCSALIDELNNISEQIGSLKSDEFHENDISNKQYLFNLRQQLTITQYELKKELIDNCFLYKDK